MGFLGLLRVSQRLLGAPMNSYEFLGASGVLMGSYEGHLWASQVSGFLMSSYGFLWGAKLLGAPGASQGS
jgi:hypothetical protein